MLKETGLEFEGSVPENVTFSAKNTLAFGAPCSVGPCQNTHSTMQNLQIVKNNTSYFDIAQAILREFK